MLIDYPRQLPPYDPAPAALAIALAFAVSIAMILIALRTDLRAAHRITWETTSARRPRGDPGASERPSRRVEVCDLKRAAAPAPIAPPPAAPRSPQSDALQVLALCRASVTGCADESHRRARRLRAAHRITWETRGLAPAAGP